MRTHTLATVAGLALVALIAARATQADHVRASERTSAKNTVNCAKPPHRNAIHGTLSANLEITAYSAVCVVSGRVTGNVTVRSADRRCTTGSRFVALSLEGGRIDGQVAAAGKQCVMVWLFDGAFVRGDIVYRAAGNLGFLGDRGGARVPGNVLLDNGHLWATGRSKTNRVDGNLVCGRGHPGGLRRLATRTNWDGAGRDDTDERVDVDGRIGGEYLGCRRTR